MFVNCIKVIHLMDFFSFNGTNTHACGMWYDFEKGENNKNGNLFEIPFLLADCLQYKFWIKDDTVYLTTIHYIIKVLIKKFSNFNHFDAIAYDVLLVFHTYTQVALNTMNLTTKTLFENTEWPLNIHVIVTQY